MSSKELATQSILTALHNIGIDVIKATDEMIQQIIEAEMQKRKALKTVSVQNEHQQTVISSAYGYKCIKRFGLYNKKYESVKKNISKFTYELEEDYEEEDDNYDGEDEYPL